MLRAGKCSTRGGRLRDTGEHADMSPELALARHARRTSARN